MIDNDVMRGLWLEEGRVRLRGDLPRPAPASDEALVRVQLTGICGTDLAMLSGYSDYTGIPGHEFVGEVVESADAGLVGTRVVGEISAACGTCPTCVQERLPGHCPTRTVLGIQGRPGSMAEYLTLPLVNLHPVPEGVSDEAAVFCEPLAAALQIQEQVAIRPGSSVLVVGAGRLGQLVARTLALTGCRLTVVARHARQRERLRLVGVEVVEPGGVRPRSAEVVVEASGSPSGFALSVDAVHPRGTVVLKSTYSEPLPLDTGRVVVDELTIVASRCGPFPAALRLLQQGAVDPAPLIHATLSLDEGVRAFELAARPGTLKVLLTL
jgi:2-desacetyl-2-hydroxyethyl bacteriochlorophyllide A dehydrogenase